MVKTKIGPSPACRSTKPSVGLADHGVPPARARPKVNALAVRRIRNHMVHRLLAQRRQAVGGVEAVPQKKTPAGAGFLYRAHRAATPFFWIFRIATRAASRRPS